MGCMCLTRLLGRCSGQMLLSAVTSEPDPKRHLPVPAVDSVTRNNITWSTDPA